MPLNRYVVRVDPQGQAMAVDILDMTATSVPAYVSPQFDAALLTLPLTISSPTDFWLTDPGAYDVSCKVSGAEVATAGAVRRVRTSDGPALVVPDWERHLTADPVPSGGSGAVLHARLAFTFNTAGLATGVTVPGWVPKAGDTVLAYRFSISQAWDGTTPTADFYVANTTLGFLNALGALAVMTVPDDPTAYPDSGLVYVANARSGVSAIYTVAADATACEVVVTTDGTKAGNDPAATQGVATLDIWVLTSVI